MLDDVSLEVYRGEVVSIIGQSGMGKSLILKHIIGLLIPDGGRILLDEEEIASPTKRPADFERVRKRFGMLFQGAALFDSKTVGENIAFPLRERTSLSAAQIEAKTVEALHMVGLQGIENKLPAELSGGMRSRVGLARALVMQPEIMLYDEPTSALDPIMSDKISDLIIELKEKLGMTSIVVTHDMNSAYRISDRIAMIYEGRIICSGTPGEIRASRNPYVQQFISGRRKLHYAVTAEPAEKAAYDRPVDMVLLQHRTRMAEALQGLKARPAHDVLTGLVSAAGLKRHLTELFERGRTSGFSLALAIGEVDFYQETVRRHGEAVGRTILRTAASELRACVRSDSDLVARYGENSFVLILTSGGDTRIGEAIRRVHGEVGSRSFAGPDGAEVTITMSFGIAVLTPSDASCDTLFARAEKALEDARRGGHNRVEIAVPA